MTHTTPINTQCHPVLTGPLHTPLSSVTQCSQTTAHPPLQCHPVLSDTGPLHTPLSCVSAAAWNPVLPSSLRGGSMEPSSLLAGNMEKRSLLGRKDETMFSPHNAWNTEPCFISAGHVELFSLPSPGTRVMTISSGEEKKHTHTHTHTHTQ